MAEDKYICGYCGAEYDSPAARARCELECDEKQKAEVERERRRKLEEERDSRLKEVNDALNTYNMLVAQFNRDYPTTSVLDEMFLSDFPFLRFGRRGVL